MAANAETPLTHAVPCDLDCGTRDYIDPAHAAFWGCRVQGHWDFVPDLRAAKEVSWAVSS